MMWRQSPSFPDYEVSESGNVRRLFNSTKGHLAGTVLRRGRRPNGYFYVTLTRGGLSFTIKTSRLVAEAFIKPSPFAGAEVCHNDGVRSNDHYQNLRWDTKVGNQADRIRHGTDSRGKQNGKAKLSECDVFQIRNLAAGGHSRVEICSRFGIQASALSKIVLRQRWSHLPVNQKEQDSETA